MISNYKLVYVGFAYPHHKGLHAGYSHIKDYLNYDIIVDCQREYEFSFVKGNILRRIIRRLYAIIFGEFCSFTMLYCLFLSWKYRKDNIVFHLIHGDNIYSDLFFNLKCKHHKVVSTLHQPYGSYIESNNEKMIVKPDKIILLSDSEIDLFKKLTNKNNVFFIPHGICTDFYKVADKQKDHSVLMVGNWLRDFDFAEKVFQSLKSSDPNIKINMVGDPSRKKRFQALVNYYSNISDEELRDLYWSSSVVFLPLIRYTANNSLLEAASTGANILIMTDTIDDNSYFPEHLISINTLDEEDAVQTLKEMIKSNFYNQKLSLFVSENYSWYIVAECVKRLLVSEL